MPINTVRCGSTTGTNAPVVFIENGKNVNCTFSQYRLNHVYGLPEWSIAVCNKTAYMYDETWIKTVQAIAPGIRAVPVFRDHPE